MRIGARPIFVDIAPKTYNIDASKIGAAVPEKTRAIMPVHLFGQMADMDPIMAVAKKHDLFVVEDAAQAIGAEYKGRRAGSIGTRAEAWPGGWRRPCWRRRSSAR